MFKLGLKNLRRLRSVDPVEIRPLTLLVGKNSSGKSSFLRVFPLLRQSTITRSSAPVLWYGDLVDFGNFETTVSDNKRDNDIVFSYVLSNVSDRIIRMSGLFHTYEDEVETQQYLPFNAKEIRVDVSVTGDSLSTKLSRVDVNIVDLNISGSIIVDRGARVTTLIVDGVDIGAMFKEPIDVTVSSALLPSLLTIVAVTQIKRRIPLLLALQQHIRAEVSRLMKKSLHGRVGDDTRLSYAGALLRMSELDEKNANLVKSRITGHSFSAYIEQLVGDAPTKEMSDIVRLHRILRVCPETSGWIA